MQCQFIDLGVVDFQDAYVMQKKLWQQACEDACQRLIICEHPAVFTLGKIAQERFLLVNAEDLRHQHIALVRTDRGGEVTFHGPGQLVIYPIFHLEPYGKDLKIFLEKLEEVVIDLLRYFGIVANRQKGFTGVWVKEKKIASVGIGVKKWVSFHGIGLNVNTDLSFFSMIKPCGLDVAMTSMANETGSPLAMARVKEKIVEVFKEHFSLEMVS
jgi:lipoate-protein ligase B